MIKPRLLSGLLAAAFVGSTASAATGPISGYYVVVPLQGRTAPADVITVSLSSYTLPDALVGIPYEGFSFKTLLSVTGDPGYTGYGVKWSIVSGALPAGMVLNSDGSVSGTPTTGGTASFKIRAAYKTKTGTTAYQILVGSINVALAAGTPPQAIVGQPYSYDLKSKLSVTGDKAYKGTGVSWSVVSSTLPAGLTLLADGTIGGTPSAAGTGSVTARAAYRNAQGEQTYDVVSLAIVVDIDPTSPPQAIVGQAYAFDIKPLLKVTGDGAYSGSGVTWSAVSSTLPAGLTLRSDGTIGGTPAASGTGAITARATYRGVNGEQTYQIVSLNITVALAAGTPQQAIVGQAYSYDLKSKLTISGDSAYTGSDVTWTVVSNNLPTGLKLLADGTIGGTPTAGGTGSITARATYRGNSGDQTYQVVSLAINVALATGTPQQGIVGQAYSYDLKPKLSVTGDAAYNGSGVTWTVVSNSLPAGLSLKSDGTIAGTPTAAGTGSLTARATYRGNNGDQTYQVVTLNINVALATGTPPQAIVGQAYSYDLTPKLSVTGDSAYNGSGVTWTIVSSSLPAGLTLRSDGTIGGTPTASGTGNLTARATYRNVNGDQTYQVVSLGINVALATGSPPQAIAGQAYSYDLKPLLSVTGDSGYDGSGVSWTATAGSLPAGLSLASDGTISGTPSGAGTGTITARATYRGVNGQQNYQVISLAITVALASGSPQQAIVGQGYSYDLKPLLTVSGDSAYSGSGITWTVVSNSLPPGLSLQGNGTIGGTPTGAGTGTVTARATYRGVNGQQVYQVVSLAINVTLGAGAPPAARVAEPYVYDLKPLLGVTGDSGYTGAGVTWSVVANTLPSGLSMTTDGVISGTPTAATSGSLTARATYRNVYGQQAYNITAAPAYTFSWQNNAWTTPSACGSTTQTRSVWCQRSDGTTMADASCAGAGTKPATSNGTTDYSACTYGWQSTGWATPAACGPTTQTRSVYCQRSDGTTVADGSCTGTKPAATNPSTDYSTCGYSWQVTGWSTPAACGSTTATRTVYCLRSDGTTVADASCSGAGAKPAATTGTTDYSTCGYSWQATGWVTPAACGATTATRTVYCQRSDGSTVADASCAGAGAKPAATTGTSNYSACTYGWTYSGWSTPAACGGTTATRSVWCQRSDGTTVADASCGGGKPAASTGTSDYSACSYSWNYTGWSTPAACGATTATRSVWCQRSDGTTVADASCGGGKPAASTGTSDYSACSYTWQTGGWSVPAACGATTQTRSVWCQRSDGATVSNTYCGGGQPAASAGTTNYSACSYSYSYGGWGSCSASCGGGTQTRSATCMRSDGTAVANANCGTAVTSQACNTQSCAKPAITAYWVSAGGDIQACYQDWVCQGSSPAGGGYPAWSGSGSMVATDPCSNEQPPADSVCATEMRNARGW